MPIRSAALFVTEDCNLRRRYCYVVKKPRRLSLDVGRETLDFMLAAPPDVKQVAIYFFGGEPLLEFGTIQALTEYGVRRSQEVGKRIHFGVTTNGTLLSDNVLAFLVKHKISINLSLDGGPDTQNTNRKMANGRGSFELVDRVIDRLVQHNPKQSVRMTYDVASAGALSENIEYLWGRGFTSLSPAPAVEDKWTKRDLAVAEEQYRRVAYAVLARMRRGEYRRIGYLEKFMRRIAATRKRRPRQQCSAGTTYVGISVDGEIYPCHRFIGYRQFKFGNLDQVTHPANREKFLTFDANRLTICDGCRARLICGGGCFAANYACTGDMYRPPPTQCAFIRMHYDAAKWLYDKLRAEQNDLLERVVLRKRKRPADEPACPPSGRSTKP